MPLRAPTTTSLLAATLLVLTACGGGGGGGGTGVENYSFTGEVQLDGGRRGALNVTTGSGGNASGSVVIDGASYPVSGRVLSSGADLQFGDASGSKPGGTISGGNVLADGISNAAVSGRLPVLIWPNARLSGNLGHTDITKMGSYVLTLGADGSGSGTVTVGGATYSASGSLSSSGANISFGTAGAAGGTISGGIVSAWGLSDGKWAGRLPTSAGSSTLGDYSGLTQASLTTASGGRPATTLSSTTAPVSGSLYANGKSLVSSSGGGGGSSSGSGSGGWSGSGGSSGATCSLSGYVGPKDDIQTYSFCQQAYVYKCAGDNTSRQKVCTLLDSFLKSISAGSAHGYCSNYC